MVCLCIVPSISASSNPRCQRYCHCFASCQRSWGLGASRSWMSCLCATCLQRQTSRHWRHCDGSPLRLVSGVSCAGRRKHLLQSPKDQRCRQPRRLRYRSYWAYRPLVLLKESCLPSGRQQKSKLRMMTWRTSSKIRDHRSLLCFECCR